MVVGHYFLVIFLQTFDKLALYLIDLLLSCNAKLDEFFCVFFINWFLVFDFLIHERLSEVRLILFIMAMSPVPNDIDEEIFFEFGPIRNCYLNALID